MHACEFMLDLLESFADSLRNTQKYKEKAWKANVLFFSAAIITTGAIEHKC
jgi:hypothetical protein